LITIDGILTGVDFMLALKVIVALCKATLKKVDVNCAPRVGKQKSTAKANKMK
jgi:hypothetical protein